MRLRSIVGILTVLFVISWVASPPAAGSLCRSESAFARQLCWKCSPGAQPASHFRRTGEQNHYASRLQASCGRGTSAQDHPNWKRLEQIAISSLNSNIVSLNEGKMVRAGGHQFQALWTRDFAYASRGLFAIGRPDVVRDELELIFSHLRDSDSLVPKYFDSSEIWFRYLALLSGHVIPVSDPLEPQYMAGIPASEAIDSNALILLTAIAYLKATKDQAWWNQQRDYLLAAFRFYDRNFERTHDNLIQQGVYADWQDSVKREGSTFYTNLLYYTAAKELSFDSKFKAPIDLAGMRQKIITSFYDKESGLFRSIEGKPYFSLDGNLLAIDLGFFDRSSPEARDLYRSLLASEFWKRGAGLPGFSTYPDYPEDDVDFLERFYGIGHYHDRLYWSWLIALSAKVACLMQDSQNQDLILDRFQKMAERDGLIYEIYSEDADHVPFSSKLYHSESPFTWGAGMVLDALSLIISKTSSK